MVGSLFFFTLPGPAMSLSNPIILGMGAQSVIANRDIQYSNSSNKYEGVRQ